MGGFTGYSQMTRTHLSKALRPCFCRLSRQIRTSCLDRQVIDLVTMGSRFEARGCTNKNPVFTGLGRKGGVLFCPA